MKQEKYDNKTDIHDKLKRIVHKLRQNQTLSINGTHFQE